MAAEIEMRNRIAITIPVIALYSRRDAVVAWQACIDANAQNVEHIEVRTTHIGFGFSPEVYKIIAQRLAAYRSPLPNECNVSCEVGAAGALLGKPSAD